MKELKVDQLLRHLESWVAQQTAKGLAEVALRVGLRRLRMENSVALLALKLMVG